MSRNATDRNWLLEPYRDYLHLLSRVGLDAWPRALADSSAVVQQTLLRAHERIGQFRGTGEAESLGWLRAILARHLADLARQAGQPQWEKGQSLEVALEQSSARLAARLADEQPSPGEQAQRREQLLHLTEALAVSPDARWVAAALSEIGVGDLTVHVWDAAIGAEVHVIPQTAEETVTSLFFSPDGKRLASAGFNAKVKIWDTESGLELLTLAGHTSWIW